MLRLYDPNHNQLQPLINYQGLEIESEVNGEEVLSFDCPLAAPVTEECYIRTPRQEYVVKEISKANNSDTFSVVAKINVEDLKGTPIKYFESIEQNPKSCLQLAFSYTPELKWTVESSVLKKRTIRLTQKSIWDILQTVLATYNCEMKIDTLNHTITIEESIGEDKGVYFQEDLNLRECSIDSDSYDLVTRIYPVGKDGLTIEEVNEGIPYVENHQFTDKVLAVYWEDNRYTNAESLKEDAIARLEEVSKPVKSYELEVLDFARINGTPAFEFNIGDYIWLKSKTLETIVKHRIVKMKVRPDQPESNILTIATQAPSLTGYVSDSLSISEVVGTITTQDGKIDSSKLPPGSGGGGLTIEEIEAMITIRSHNIEDGAITTAKIGDASITSAKIAEGQIQSAHIEDGTITSAKIGDGQITSAKIGTGQIDAAHIQDGVITSAKIGEGEIKSANIDDGAITNAKIEDGTITSAKIGTGEIKSANIEDGTITSAKIGEGEIGSANIHDGAITSAKIGEGEILTAHIHDGAIDAAKIQDASITSAKILELDAGLIKTGTLATERLMLVGYDEEGNLHSIVWTLNNLNGSLQQSSNTIDGASITDKTITANNIMSNTITGDLIQSDTIEARHLKAGSITANELAAGSITADKIAGGSLTLNQFDPSVKASILEEAAKYTDANVSAFGEFLNFNPETGLTLGSNSTQFKTVIDSDSIDFYAGDTKISWITNEGLQTNNVTVNENLYLGKYKFVVNDDFSLSLVWVG